MNKAKQQFIDILKKKGTGKTMSKHMDADDIQFVTKQIQNPDIPLATKSTLLTAWLMLESTPEESDGLHHIIEHQESSLPSELTFLFRPKIRTSPDRFIHSLIQYKSLPNDHIQSVLDQFIAGNIPNYKLAAFLEGLRLKEESREENECIHQYFLSKTNRLFVDVPLLVDIGTPYDGFNRNYFLQPFVSALLASIGIPSILHGVFEVSPKKGMNTHKVLVAAGKDPFKSMADVKAGIEDPNIGWGYIDQSIFCPELHQLLQTRIDMVKRPVLATIEKWLQPFSAHHTVCVTGFTHPPYKQKTIDIIHSSKLYSQLVLVRGVEGSTLLPYDRRAPFITSCNNTSPIASFISPEDFGAVPAQIAVQDPNESLQVGLDGLSGNNPLIKEYLCYQAFGLCKSLPQYDDSIIDQLNHAIDSGLALQHWDAF